jgi:hypothetical protein
MMLGMHTAAGDSECVKGLGNVMYYDQCRHYICKDLSCLQT